MPEYRHVKIKFGRTNKTVHMQVLEQIGERNGFFVASNGIKLILTKSCPFISLLEIQLRGYDPRYDDCIASRPFDSVEKAIIFIKEASKAVREYNDHYSKQELSTEKQDEWMIVE